MIWAKVIINFMHLSAITAWIGSIVLLTLILFPLFKMFDTGESVKIIVPIFRIFRILSVVCLVIIILSGIIMSLQQESGEITLLGTYGIIFLIKHILTLVIMALILFSVFYLFPKVKPLCENLDSEKELCFQKKRILNVMVTCSSAGIVVLFLTALMQLL
jgi:putative copper export protein